jgi:hypothetical protein
MAITTAVSDFISSIYELIATFISTFFHLIKTAFDAIIGFVSGFFELIVSTVSTVFGVAVETGRFLIGKSNASDIRICLANLLLGNALLIIIVAGGFVAWLRYMKSQDKPVVVGNKKLN